MTYCWEENFLNDRRVLTCDGKEIGYVEPLPIDDLWVADLWVVFYGTDVIGTADGKVEACAMLVTEADARRKKP
jgi:hypothetical protein